MRGPRDFSGDNETDILWRDDNTGTIAVWFMHGTTVERSSRIRVEFRT